MLDKLSKYPWIIPLAFGLIVFVFTQAQRVGDRRKTELKKKDDLSPEFAAILAEVKNRLPNKQSGIMLCEFENGDFDIAVGLSGQPLFVFVRKFGKKISKVIDMTSEVDREFIEVNAGSDLGVLTVFDEQGAPLIGSFKIADEDSFEFEGAEKPFLIGQSLEERGQCVVEKFTKKFRYDPNDDFQTKDMSHTGMFKISIENTSSKTTTPIFLNDTTLLGFMTVIIPSQYKTTQKKVAVDDSGKNFEMRSERILVSLGGILGVFASRIFKNNCINLDLDFFRPSEAIDNR